MGARRGSRDRRRRLKVGGLGVLQRIRRKVEDVEFGPLEWLSPEQLDPAYFTLLPSREESFSARKPRR